MERDYGQAAMPTQNVAASNTAPGIPDTAAGNNGSASADVPSATANTTSAAPLETPAVASKDLIHVKTDVLDLAIDPVGGDVVQLRLLCTRVVRIVLTCRSSCSITAASVLFWRKAA